MTGIMSSPVSGKKNNNNKKACSGQNIKVFVRCRPMNTQEKLSRSHSLVECQSNRDVVVRERPQDKFTKTFSFDRVFGPDSKQLDVYKCVARPLVDEVLNGFNCTIFAYGQTGTGKTFTMEGDRTVNCTTWQDDPLAGIIPRCVNHLFDELRIQKLEFTMRVSFLELYNEELFDLLSANDDMSKLRLYEDSSRKGSCIIQGLEEMLVRTKNDVYSVIEKGSAKRQTAATLMNAHSSRSHTVFTVTVHIKENTLDGDELMKTGKLHLVDLAGSENIGRSGAQDKRAREAGNINQSLLTLGRVITSLVEKAPHIPYRESKLTRLLQDALGGRTKTSIIATVSPASVNLEETLSTLDYAHRAKNITNKPEVNQKLNKKELIGEYTEEIERLRRDLLAMREKNGVYLANENYQEMMETMEQQAKEIMEKIAHIRTIEDELDKKKELFQETSRMLEETSDRLQSTEHSLLNTRQDLRNTQTLLHTTAQDRDEQRYLVAAHMKTEGVLQTQGRSLINVADTTTNHIQLLQEKISRKCSVEDRNSEEAVSFEGIFTSNITTMQAVLTQFKNRHSDAIRVLANEQGSFVSSFEQSVTASVSQLSAAGAALSAMLATMHTLLSDASCFSASSLRDVTEAVCAARSSEGERLAQYQAQVLRPLLETVATMAASQTQLLDTLRDTVATKTRELVASCSASHAQHVQHSSSTVECLQQQLHSISRQAEQHMAGVRTVGHSTVQHSKVVRERLQQLIADVMQLDTLTSDHCAAITQHTDSMEEEHRLAMEEATEAHAKLHDAAEAECGRGERHVASVAARGQEATDQLHVLHTQAVSSVQQLSSHSEEMCSGMEASIAQTEACMEELAQQQQTICQRMEEHAQDTDERVAHHIASGEEIISMTVTEQCAALSSYTEQLQRNTEQQRAAMEHQATDHSDALAEHNVLLHERLSELNLLFAIKMVKDVPTGHTPVRQEYPFSRRLSATSPHERLLQRYRVANTATIASTVPLPAPQDNELDGSSFSSLDNSGTVDSVLCSDPESPSGLSKCRAASLVDVRTAVKTGVFAMPSVPNCATRHGSRDDGPLTCIPAPLARPHTSAPVSRSASVSSLTDCKENRILNTSTSSLNNNNIINNNSSSSSSKKLRAAAGPHDNTNERRTRRVLGSHN